MSHAAKLDAIITKVIEATNRADALEARMDADDPFARLDANWSESDHPRAGDGKFGSGGGGSSSSGIGEFKQSSPHPFVHAFMKSHHTIGAMKSYLKTVPEDKLHTAKKLIKDSGDMSAGSKLVYDVVEAELKARGK